MSDDTRITLSDGTTTVEFFGARPDPTTAFGGWEFSDLVDWRGLPGDKSRGDERPNAHGDFQENDVWRAARVISWKARFIGATQQETDDAIDALSALGSHRPVLMMVEGPTGASERVVTVAGVTPLDLRSRRFASVAIDVKAADPLRYAVSAQVPWEETGPPTPGVGRTWPAVWPLVWPGGGSSGRLLLTNTGKAASAPQFQLLGGFASVLVTNVETGERIGFDRFVPVGSTIEIDSATHLATIDGQSDVSRWIRWREWSVIPPGESRSFQFDVTGPAGSPKLKGRVLSAWW